MQTKAKTIQHTPGPWDRIEHNPVADLLGMEGVMIVGTDDANVALTFDDAIGRANARLIAAAPKLLAVVRRLIAEDDAGEYTVGLIEDARAAVAEVAGDTR